MRAVKQASPASAIRDRGVIAEMLARMGEKDGRVASGKRAGLGRSDLLAWRVCRFAVMRLTVDRTRLWLAGLLDVAEGTIENWVSPSGESVPRAGQMFRLIELLGREDRMLAVRAIAEMYGLDVVQVGAAADGAGLQTQTLEISGALGKLSERVRLATCARGPRGERITGDERIGILRGLDELVREAAEMRASLETADLESVEQTS
ncbi:MAG: hypothetical protein WAZ94_13295 [Phycisphaerales bacterium]